MEMAQIRLLIEAAKLIRRLATERNDEVEQLLKLGDTVDSRLLLNESKLLLEAAGVLHTRINEELSHHE